MTKIEKKDAMESAGTHHTIEAPRTGQAPHEASGTSATQGAPSAAAEVPSGDSETGNAGFDMRQPQEWAPRDRASAGSPEADVDAGDAKAASTDTSPPPSVADGGTAVPGSALSREELEQMTDNIIAALKTVYDPEIPADIYELGLIYKIDIKDNRDVEIDMTLTAPGCPVAGEMPQWVENAVRSVAGVGEVSVNLVFDPPWDMSRMSDEARLAINMF